MVLRSGQSQEHQRKLWKSGSCLGASEAMSHSRGVLLARSFYQMLVQVCTRCKSSTRCGTVGKSDNSRWTTCGFVYPQGLSYHYGDGSIQPRKLERCYWASANDSFAPAATYCRSAYPARHSYGQTLCRFALHTAPDVGGKAMCNSPVWQRLDRPFGCQKR